MSDTKLIQGKNAEAGTLDQTLSPTEVNTAYPTPVPEKAPGVIVLKPGTNEEEHLFYRNRDADAGTVTGLIRDYSNLNGGDGREHLNGSPWETLQSIAYVNNLVDAVKQGFWEEIAIVTRVDDTNFTVVGDKTSIYTEGRVVRFNKDNTKIGLTSSSSYSAGTGLTTVVVQDVVVPNPLEEVESGIQPINSPAPVFPNATQTLTNKTLTAPVINNPKSTGAYQDWVDYAYAATITLDLADGNLHRTAALTGDATLAIDNPQTGQAFVVRIPQDGSGGRTVTWFPGISWTAGEAPDQAETLNTVDVYGFICTDDDSANAYANPTFDGFVIGTEMATA